MIADLIIIAGSLRTEYGAFDNEWAEGNYYTAGIFSAKALVTALIGVDLALNQIGFTFLPTNKEPEEVVEEPEEVYPDDASDI